MCPLDCITKASLGAIHSYGFRLMSPANFTVPFTLDFLQNCKPINVAFCWRWTCLFVCPTFLCGWWTHSNWWSERPAFRTTAGEFKTVQHFGVCHRTVYEGYFYSPRVYLMSRKPPWLMWCFHSSVQVSLSDFTCFGRAFSMRRHDGVLCDEQAFQVLNVRKK